MAKFKDRPTDSSEIGTAFDKIIECRKDIENTISTLEDSVQSFEKVEDEIGDFISALEDWEEWADHMEQEYENIESEHESEVIALELEIEKLENERDNLAEEVIKLKEQLSDMQ